MKSSLDLAYLLYCRPHLGGSGVMSLELAKQMRRKGHNVTLISYPGTFLSSEEQEMGINLVQTQAINYPCFKSEPFSETFASVIANLGEEKNLNIIHANYAITHGLAATTAKRILERKGKDLKVLVTSHGSDIHTNGHHHLLAPTIEQILWESDAISFVSESLQTEAEELFPSIKNKGEAIYNFVDTDRFRFSEDERRSIRSAEKIPDGATVIYHASNFRELKNAQDLISIAINDKVGVYLETYGDIVEFQELLVNFDTGLTYLVKDNLQLDFSFGTGINHTMNYISLGFSWKTLKKESRNY